MHIEWHPVSSHPCQGSFHSENNFIRPKYMDDPEPNIPSGSISFLYCFISLLFTTSCMHSLAAMLVPDLVPELQDAITVRCARPGTQFGSVAVGL